MTENAGRWRNRIVGYGAVNPRDVALNPRNWREHSPAQLAALEAALGDVGWLQDVIINRTTGHLVDGEARVLLARERGEVEIPCKYVALTPEEEALALLTLDPLGAMAGTKAATFEALRREVEGGYDAGAVSAALQDVWDGVVPEGVADATVRETQEETLLDQAVQLRPARQYVVVMCDTEEEWEALRARWGLTLCRRGGYKPGSTRDAVGIDRVVPARRVLAEGTGDARGDTE